MTSQVVLRLSLTWMLVVLMYNYIIITFPLLPFLSRLGHSGGRSVEKGGKEQESEETLPFFSLFRAQKDDPVTAPKSWQQVMRGAWMLVLPSPIFLLPSSHPVYQG